MLRWFRCPQKRLNSPPIWRDSPFRHSSGGINAKTIKSKVLIVNHGYPPQFSGGSEAYAQTLALQLLKSGRCEEVNVMAREHDPFRDDGRDASTRLVEKSPRKAVIPIAGKGTRMGPQSAVTPKALLPLPFGKNDIRPALTCLLNQLLATDTGLQEVCLVVAPNQMQIVEQYLASLDSQGCAAGSGNVSIVLQDTPLGLGDAVLAAQHFVDNEPFLLALGDHWFTPGVATQFLAAYRTLVTTLGASARDRVGLTGACLCTEDEIPLTGLLQTTCDVNGALNPEGVSLVLNMCEKSTDPLQYKKYAVPSSLESSYLSQLGMDVLPPTIFGYLAAQKVSLSAQDGEINLRSAMKDVLVAKGDLHACLVDGARLDFGIPSGYRTTFTQLNALLGNTTAPKPLEQASSKFVGSLSSWLDRVGIRHHADDCADIIHVASSPGRIDLMGGFADYSGSRVLNARTEERCYAFVSLSDRHNNLELTSVQVRSLKDAFYGDSQDQKSEVRRATIPSKVLWGGSDIRSRLTTKSQLRASLERDWPSYLVGVIHAALERQSVGAERFANANNPSKLPAGVCVTVVSDLPWNAGLASSAAVEISTALAMSHALGLPESALHPFNIAAMCKAVENQVVGANCGIMDHLAVACAPDAGNFDTYMLAFDCRWPARTPVMEAVALPAGISVVAVESGVVRSITDPPYENVRVASRIGLGLINEAIRKNSGEGHPVIENLCDVPLSVFQRQYLYLLPERVLGADLVGSTTFDANSELSSFAIDPSFNYRVRAATAHPIEEHARVQTFEAVVKGMHGQQSDVEQARSHELLGELMHQAHASYSNCGLGTQETDLLASLIRNQPSSSVKVIGAKISGGGGGGALSVVLWDDANKSNKTEEFFNEIQAKYYRQTGLICTLRSGASGRMKYHGTIKKP